MTSERPTRASPAGRAYLALQNKARRDRRPTDELLQLYALEGFLDRLALSPYATRLILKGGVLLSAFDTRRATRDVDLQAEAIDNDAQSVRSIVCHIARIDVDDGIEFDTVQATVEVIRDEEVYGAVRVSLAASLASANLPFHVDVSVGDPIWPAPQTIALPRLLGGEIILRGYPLAMVYAEKLVTAVARGTASTRWRDFADVYLLTRRHAVNGTELVATIRRVALHRKVDLLPLEQILDGYASLAQSKWAAWRRKYRLDNRLPESFASVLEEVIAFSDGAITDTVAGRTWEPIESRWS